MPAALLFTTKPRRRPNFRPDTFRLLPVPAAFYLQQSPSVGLTLSPVYIGFYRL